MCNKKEALKNPMLLFYFLSISKCTHCISNAFGNFRGKDKFRYLLFLYYIFLCFFFHLNILLF